MTALNTRFGDFLSQLRYLNDIIVSVNTFRRNDLLELFLDHYTQCEDVERALLIHHFL